MRYLILAMLMLLPVIAPGQISITRSGGIIIQNVQGDTLQLRGSTPFYNVYRTALSDALNYQIETGIQVFIVGAWQDRIVGGFQVGEPEVIEVPVEVPVDSVVITESDALRNINWTVIDDNPPGELYWFKVDGYSVSDELHIRYECGDTMLSHHAIIPSSGVFADSLQAGCMEVLNYTVTAKTGQWEKVFSDSVDIGFFRSFDDWTLEPVNQFVVDGQNFDRQEWTQMWNDNSTFYINDSRMFVDISVTGSQVWRFEKIPLDVQEIEVYAILDVSTGSSMHIRALSNPEGHSQDVYFAGNFIRYGHWVSGNPGNTANYSEPVTVPFDHGNTEVELLMKIEAGVLYAKAWILGTEEPQDWMLQTEAISLEPGGFGVGAHSARARYFRVLRIGINGAPAPR